jgi:hypothetical protein
MSNQILPYFRRKWESRCGLRGSKPCGRARATTKLDTWAEEHGLPPEPSARMKQAVIALFADIERNGEIDWRLLPPPGFVSRT